MDDLNDSNPLLDDDKDDEELLGFPDLNDDQEGEKVLDSLDFPDMNLDLGNLDTGTYTHSPKLVDGNPLLDDEDYYTDALPSNPDNLDGHGEWEDSSHKVPDSYIDVNGNEGSYADDSDDESLPEYHYDNYNSDYNNTVRYNNDVVDEVDEDFVKNDEYVNDDYEEQEFDDSDSLENILEISDRDKVDPVDEISMSSDVGSILDDAFSDDDVDDKFAGAYDLDDEDIDEFGGFDIDAILSLAIKMEASDVHISSDDLVSFSVLSDIHKIQDFGVVPAAIVQRIFTEITSHVSQSDFSADLELDTSYVIRTGEHKGRSLRLNVVKSMSNFAMVFRVITNNIPTPEDLGINDSLLDWCSLSNGLVMLNGKTGSGKTTTLASLIRKIQLTRPCKIITIERPVEFIYGTDGKALITQREVGRDTRTFAGALTSAMRQAPDIIMLGEVRTKVEVNELLRAAETGHLAISTMHTNSAPATVNRIRSLYEGDDQVRILGSLAEVARGFANQALVKTKDGSGRFAVREVLDVNEEVSKMIAVADIEGMKNYQMDNRITMEHGLVQAIADNKCTVSEARSETSDKSRFDKILKELG